MDLFSLREPRTLLAILHLVGFIGAGSAFAGSSNDPLPSNVPSAEEVASLIGGGNVLARITSYAGPTDLQCTYEYAPNQDGSHSKNNALLSVVSYSDANAARAIFDGYIRSSISALLGSKSLGSSRILRLEQGATYTAFSDGNVARAIHGTTLVTFALMDLSRTRSRSSDYLHWSDKIRQLAVRAAGAAPEPAAQIGPPPGLPKAIADNMSWNFMDDAVWPVVGLLPWVLPPTIIIVVFVSIWLRARPRRREIHSAPVAGVQKSPSQPKKIDLRSQRVNTKPRGDGGVPG